MNIIKIFCGKHFYYCTADDTADVYYLLCGSNNDFRDNFNADVLIVLPESAPEIGQKLPFKVIGPNDSKTGRMVLPNVTNFHLIEGEELNKISSFMMTRIGKYKDYNLVEDNRQSQSPSSFRKKRILITLNNDYLLDKLENNSFKITDKKEEIRYNCGNQYSNCTIREHIDFNNCVGQEVVFVLENGAVIETTKVIMSVEISDDEWKETFESGKSKAKQKSKGFEF